MIPTKFYGLMNQTGRRGRMKTGNLAAKVKTGTTIRIGLAGIKILGNLLIYVASVQIDQQKFGISNKRQMMTFLLLIQLQPGTQQSLPQ